MAQNLTPHDQAPEVDELECLDRGRGECSGPVEYRWPGYGHRSWPRCEHHGEARVRDQEAANRRLGHPDSASPPAGFDPADAGERWDEDY